MLYILYAYIIYIICMLYLYIYSFFSLLVGYCTSNTAKIILTYCVCLVLSYLH